MMITMIKHPTGLNPEVTSRMMFAQENAQLIREHWNKLMPNVPFLESHLPPLVKDVDEKGNLLIAV